MTTPHRWLTYQRLLAAQRQLETTNAPIDEIAETVGMQTAETLRHHFRERFQTSPTAYRRPIHARRAVIRPAALERHGGITGLLSEEFRGREVTLDDDGAARLEEVECPR